MRLADLDHRYHVMLITVMSLFAMSFKFGTLTEASGGCITYAAAFDGIISFSEVPFLYMFAPLVPFIVSLIVPPLHVNVAFALIGALSTIGVGIVMYYVWREILMTLKLEYAPFVITLVSMSMIAYLFGAVVDVKMLGLFLSMCLILLLLRGDLMREKIKTSVLVVIGLFSGLPFVVIVVIIGVYVALVQGWLEHARSGVRLG